MKDKQTDVLSDLDPIVEQYGRSHKEKQSLQVRGENSCHISEWKEC